MTTDPRPTTTLHRLRRRLGLAITASGLALLATGTLPLPLLS